jgi:hypothetical protein
MRWTDWRRPEYTDLEVYTAVSQLVASSAQAADAANRLSPQKEHLLIAPCLGLSGICADLHTVCAARLLRKHSIAVTVISTFLAFLRHFSHHVLFLANNVFVRVPVRIHESSPTSTVQAASG